MADLTSSGKWALGIGTVGALATAFALWPYRAQAAEPAAAPAPPAGGAPPSGSTPTAPPATDPYADNLGRTHMVVRIYGRTPLPEPMRGPSSLLLDETLSDYEARIGKHAIMTDMGAGWEKRLAWPGPDAFDSTGGWPATSTVDQGQPQTLYLTGILDTVADGSDWKIVGFDLRGPPSPMVP